MVVIPNEGNWQIATNFLLSEAWTDFAIHCGRYEVIKDRLEKINGDLNAHQAISLLDDVSQSHTQWSVVYRASVGEIWVVMGRDYKQIYKIDIGFD